MYRGSRFRAAGASALHGENDFTGADGDNGLSSIDASTEVSVDTSASLASGLKIPSTSFTKVPLLLTDDSGEFFGPSRLALASSILFLQRVEAFSGDVGDGTEASRVLALTFKVGGESGTR